jgi:hypothetical protein
MLWSGGAVQVLLNVGRILQCPLAGGVDTNNIHGWAKQTWEHPLSLKTNERLAEKNTGNTEL